MRVIVGLTGATGSIYGVRLLERLREMEVETHLVISRWGARTLAHETPHTREYVESLATTVYPPGDMGAAISSGSFKTEGMIIVPCSAKTLAAIAHMLKLSRMGAVILPPMPAFYTHPRTIDDIVDHTVARMLDTFGIDVPGAVRWAGEMGVGED